MRQLNRRYSNEHHFLSSPPIKGTPLCILCNVIQVTPSNFQILDFYFLFSGGYSESDSSMTTLSRTERSHENPDQILVEPRGRPMDTSDSPEDPHFHPYFDDDTDTNVTYQLGKTAHLHCRIRQLGNRVVSWTGLFALLRSVTAT